MNAARKFTVEGDPADVLRLAEQQGWKIARPGWWQRTYAIPRWLAWPAGALVALHAIQGLHLIVGWLS